ncbi:23S rRNA (guanosine(2251)-2'-O)-methyltransferase RlmB [Pectinatus frisingensis]|uniref:23S rRNA (guanosine(2251)-2'-O)-methyltransferase RlmB n=1 Tax=Pectinatus frisingensis TaxID=865 RepID=UPI001E433A66|nr:23S rRNA (guanosine(2251)-2'-O)-methyltransferase RlmB [Pectinatus frisingensis]
MTGNKKKFAKTEQKKNKMSQTFTGGKKKYKKDMGKLNKNKTASFKSQKQVKDPAAQAQEISPDILTGRNAVREVLKNDRPINKLLVAENAHGGSIQEIIGLARQKKVIVHTVSQNKINELGGTSHNQGILAYTPPVDYALLEDVLEDIKQKKETPFFLILDEIEDPHNLGAVLRTADAAGVHAVIIPKRRSCPLSSTVAKVSAGAIEYVPVIRVNNIAQTLIELKEAGFWIAGADASAETFYYDANFKGALAIVIGSEGKGIGQLVRQSCDFLVKIPMYGKINSLNASNAAAILMYEALKQRML